MERAAGWRAIEPGEDRQAESRPSDNRGGESKSTGWLLVGGLAGAGLLVGVAAVLWASTPQPQLVLEPRDERLVVAGESAAADEQPAASAAAELIVDVQGAVVRPGLHRLAAGSRVGDAIAAAGGYGPQVDIRAAAERLNLAERLVDGAKVHVPARGDPTPAAVAGGTAGPDVPASAPGGPIEINGASQAQLETLPGIGPVTAGRIISAREEARFATVDELLSRKVVGPATFEKIRSLITVAP